MSLHLEEPNFSSSTVLDNEPNDWWEIFVFEQFPNDKCIHYFKCSRKTYLYLVKSLHQYIEPKINSMLSKIEQNSKLNVRRGVCVEKQVAILLYKLTSCVDYVKISKIFKIHKTTIHKILYKCIVAINRYMLHNTIYMPKNEEAKLIAKDFELVHKIPQIIGVMTIIHIPISSPINLNYKFLNSNLYPSFILQAVIDSNCCFRDVSVRHAGAVNPKLILAESNIYKYSEKVMPTEKIDINGTKISFKIVGPLTGSLKTWLIHNYQLESSQKEAVFNQYLKDIRNYSDSVVARLRSRFLILSQMMDLSYKVSPQVIAACCIIHNICEKEEDPFYEEWLTEGAQLLKKFSQPEIVAEWEKPSVNALQQRDVLRDYLCNLKFDTH